MWLLWTPKWRIQKVREVRHKSITGGTPPNEASRQSGCQGCRPPSAPPRAAPQSPAALRRRDRGRPRPEPQQPHGDVHLLRGLLRRLPFLLRQHLRGSHHHHLPGAGGQGDVRMQPGEKRGRRLPACPVHMCRAPRGRCAQALPSFRQHSVCGHSWPGRLLASTAGPCGGRERPLGWAAGRAGRGSGAGRS